MPPATGYSLRGGAEPRAWCIPDPLPHDGSSYSPFTVEHWLYLNSNATNAGLLSVFPPGSAWNDTGINLYIRSEAGAGYAFTVSGSSERTGTPPLDKWVHVAWVWTGSQIEIWEDGVLLGSTGITNIPVTGDYWHAEYNEGQATIEGQVARLRFWSKALDQAEIQHARDNALPETQPGLVVQYDLDEPADDPLGKPDREYTYALLLNHDPDNEDDLVAQRNDLVHMPYPPGEVTDPELTAANTTSLAFAWSPVDTADDYQAKIYEGATEVGSVVSVDPAAEFTGLTADTEYGLEITARNENGDGPASALFAFSTPPEGAPVDAPTDVEIEGIPEGFAGTWRFVPNADEYVMRALTMDGATVASVTTTETHAALEGLEPHTRYRVEVAGANTSGEGPAYSENATTAVQPAGDNVRLVLQGPADALTEATVDPDQGLKGHVEDLEGQGLEGRKVHIYTRLTGDRAATVETDAAGAFIWHGADPAREYFVVAINPAEDAQDYAPSAANRLTPVVVV